jgi:hypothetical protein
MMLPRFRDIQPKNLFILHPNEERSTCNPFGCLCEADLRRVFDIFDRDRCADIMVFPFAVRASDVDKAFSVDPVGALHRDLRNRPRSCHRAVAALAMIVFERSAHLRVLRPRVLWRRKQRREAIAERLHAALLDDGVTCSGGSQRVPRELIALRLDPIDAWAPPWRKCVESSVDGWRRLEQLRQDPRVLDRHAAALAHHRRTRVGGVTDQQDAALAPLGEFKRFDRAAVDLVVARQTVEEGSDRFAEGCYATVEPGETAFKRRVATGRLGDIGAPV